MFKTIYFLQVDDIISYKIEYLFGMNLLIHKIYIEKKKKNHNQREMAIVLNYIVFIALQ